MLFIASVDVFKIKDDFVTPAVSGEDNATSIYDFSTNARFANGDIMSRGDIGHELGPPVDLKFVEPREEGSAAGEDQSSEEVEAEAILGFHGGRWVSVGS